MRRPLLRAIAAVAGLAAPLLLASPASAGPDDGQGCVGIQGRPLAYVCVVTLDPTAVPSVEQTGTTTLFDENVCYFVGCRRVTVTAPTYGLDLPESPVLVIYYNGQYHSVSVASLPGAPSTDGYVAAVTGAVATGGALAWDAVEIAIEVAVAAGELVTVDVWYWLDCTVESHTDDAVDLNDGSGYSGYDLWTCTQLYLV